ncbi:MAG: tetratricopeptide repeat protein [Ardenticatenaceae bacterium]|nr:tetratricopeptide repeat protein [Ardenticatenaceae bacterium]
MLRLYSLGGLKITLDGEPVAFAARRAELLLAYLVMTGRAHERESLATMLWDDRTQKRSLSNLRSLLAQLPKEIKPYLEISRRSIQIKARDERQETRDIWFDALAFEKAIKTASPSTSPNHSWNSFREALGLYKGDFLQGIFITDSRGLEEWMALTRERLHQIALTGYRHAAEEALYRRDYHVGVEFARQLVTLDSLRENSQRLLLRLLARTGDFNAALTHYKSLETLLEKELGVPPAAETIALIARIKAARNKPTQNFTAHLPPFVGRSTEITAISERLDEPQCRLLTLLGTGGVGKTRLALAVAETLQKDFLHGAAVTPLAPLQDPTAIVTAVAQQVDCPLTAKKEPLQQLLDFLHGREMLLVLDNIEHLLPAAIPIVQRFLHLPHLTLLVTSRERLRLSLEHVVGIDGLPTDSTAGEAVDLFVRCARRIKIDFAEPAIDILNLCRLVDGLPLGIELLATATRHRSLAEIAADLGQSLKNIASDLHDTPARHQTLQAVFHYSWQLLNPDERAALQRLTIFQGGFEAEAAQDVSVVNRPMLQRLHDRSLIYSASDTRLGMLAVIRQYLLEQHPLHDDKLAAAHAGYFVSWLEKIDPQMVAGEIANVQAMWRWIVNHEPDLLGRVLPQLALYYELQGPFAEFEQLLHAANHSDHPFQQRLQIEIIHFQRLQSKLAEAESLANQFGEVTPSLAPRLNSQKGMLAIARGRYDEAKPLLTTALHLAQQQDDYHTAGVAMRGLAVLHTYLGNFQDARQLCEESLAVFEAAADNLGISQTLNNLGIICKNLNDFTAARAHYERARDLFAQMNNRLGESRILNNLGVIARIQQDYAAAHDFFVRALALKRELGEPHGEILALNNLGIVSGKMNQLEEAEQQLKDALKLTHQWAEKRHQGMVLSNLARVYHLQNRPESAITHCQQAFALAVELSDRNTEAFALLHWGQALGNLGQWKEAAAKFEQALKIRKTLNHTYLHLEVKAHYALALWQAGDISQAEAEVQSIIPHLNDAGLQQVESPQQVAEICALIGNKGQ